MSCQDRSGQQQAVVVVAGDGLQVFLMSAWSCTGSNALLPALDGCLHEVNAVRMSKK